MGFVPTLLLPSALVSSERGSWASTGTDVARSLLELPGWEAGWVWASVPGSLA